MIENIIDFLFPYPYNVKEGACGKGCKRRRRRRRKKAEQERRVADGTTDEDMYCYLGRYPDLVKEFTRKTITGRIIDGRYDYDKAREHWYTYGKDEGRNKNCPYKHSQESIDEAKKEEKKSEKVLKSETDEYNIVKTELDSIQKETKGYNKEIDNVNYLIYNKPIKVDDITVDKTKGVSIIEGMNVYGLSGVLGNLENYNEIINTVLNDAAVDYRTTSKQYQVMSNTYKSINDNNKSLYKNNLTNNKNRIENNVSLVKNIKNQNETIDNILNNDSKEYLTFEQNTHYSQDDIGKMKIINQYYLFWIYMVLVIIVSFTLLNNKEYNTRKLYFFIAVLALYPFIIYMIQKYLYNLITQIYTKMNFIVYSKEDY